MAKIVMEEWEEFPVLPDDSIIHTTIEKIEVRDVPGRDGKSGWQKLEFTFKIDGIQVVGDGSSMEKYESLVGSRIWGSVPARFNTSPENKLKQWVEAILGLAVDAGFELETDLLERRKVRAITSHYDKKTVNPTTGRPYRQHQVESLLQFGGASVAAAPAVFDEEPPF